MKLFHKDFSLACIYIYIATYIMNPVINRLLITTNYTDSLGVNNIDIGSPYQLIKFL